MYHQSWQGLLDDELIEGREFLESPYKQILDAMLENILLLRQEFDFHTLNPELTATYLILRPFMDKPEIYIYIEKPGTLCHIYHLRNQTATNEKWVPQEQLIPTVYEYIKQLKAL